MHLERKLHCHPQKNCDAPFVYREINGCALSCCSLVCQSPFYMPWYQRKRDEAWHSLYNMEKKGLTMIPSFFYRSRHTPSAFLNIVMFENILGQDQEDNPAESNDNITRDWSPAHSLSPKLAINFVPARSELNSTAWEANFETAQIDAFVQEYNLVDHVRTSQEITQHFAPIDPLNYYGTYAHQSLSTFGQPARTSATYSALIA